MAVKTTVFVLLSVLAWGSSAHAQDTPPTPPPATAPTAGPNVEILKALTVIGVGLTMFPYQAASTSASPPRVELSNDELRRRRNAIFLMEAVLMNSVKLAAMDTQSQIEAFQPGLRISMFSNVPPQARGGFLEDYGVFFLVQIPTYFPSVVKVIEELARNPVRPQSDPARPASMERSFSRDAVLDPDAYYVNAVRQYLTNAMLDQSKSLELHPNEWLTVMARGDDSGPGDPSQPSTLTLRIKGGDLVDFLAGRLTRDEALKRIEVKGTPGR